MESGESLQSLHQFPPIRLRRRFSDRTTSLWRRFRELGGPYFDPSYGVTYANEAGFEHDAVAGYAVADPGNGKRLFARKLDSTVNIGFVTAGPPSSPTLAAPLDNATNLALPITLTWLPPSTSVRYYRLQIGTESSLANSPDYGPIPSGLTSVSTDLLPLAASTKYYWRVKAWNCLAWSASPIWSFTTAP